MWPSSHSFTYIITSIGAGSQHEATLWCLQLDNKVLHPATLQCSALQSQLVGVFLLSDLVAIKWKSNNLSAVLNRHRNPWQVSQSAVLHPGCVHLLCLWLHAAAPVRVLPPRLADAAAGTHPARPALHPTLVVSTAHKTLVFRRSCLQVFKMVELMKFRNG